MRASGIFILCVIVIIGGILSLGYSTCNEPPKPTSNSEQTADTAKYDCTTPNAGLRVGLGKTWLLVHEYKEEVVAIATVFIAIFTIILGVFTVSLAGATKTAADAARKTAEAAIAIELPLIRVNEPSELWKTESAHDEDGGLAWNSDVPDLPEFSRIYELHFRNLGRTTAAPMGLQLGWEVTKIPSAREPNYNWKRRCDHGSVIPPTIKDDDGIQLECAGFGITLGEEERALIAERKASLWLFGALTYLDFLDLPHTRRFCWRWGCPDGVGMYYFHAEEGVPSQYTKKS
jgi:hypothetical protein